MEINNSSKGISLLTTDVISGKLKVIHFDNINAKNDEGYTYLHIACINMLSPIELVTSLLKNGADPNARNYNYVTPLHYASLFYNANLEIVELLLRSGATPIDEQMQILNLHVYVLFFQVYILICLRDGNPDIFLLLLDYYLDKQNLCPMNYQNYL